MGEIAKTFIAQFHGLSGDSIKERRQNLYQLLLAQRPILSQHPEELNYVCANLKPTTHLEKIFYIDFLINFRRFKELFQEFTSGNDIAISKLANHDWFFQNTFQDVKAEDFVQNILPTVGYNVRLKILKKIILSEEQYDEIFDAVHKHYGIFLATIVLPKCTRSKIQQVLKTQLVKLTASQLKLVFKKDSELISLYFEERTKHEGGTAFMMDNPVLVYIAQKNPTLFSNLFSRYKFTVKLGHRTTKNYIVSQKTNVLAERECYFNILNTSTFVRKLGNELKDLLFIDNEKNSRKYWRDILRHYPRKRQFDIYTSAYDKVYHCNFGESGKTIDEEILQIITEPEKREKFAQIKFDKDEDNEYLKYITPEHCMDDFMRKINQLTVTDRCKYVKLTTECCILNKDMKTLLKLCELIAVRFKNDDSKIRDEFLQTVCQDEKFLDYLTDQHWKHILDILAILNAKNEYNWREHTLRQRYIKYLVANNKPVRDFITKCSNILDWLEVMEYGVFICDDPVLNRTIICEIIEAGYPKLPEDDDLARPHYDCMLAAVCKKFNKKYPKNAINILNNPRIIASVKQVLESNGSSYFDYRSNSGIEYMICQPRSFKDVAEMQKLYFNSFKHFGLATTCFWFLKYDPKVFQEHLDQFLTNVDRRGINQKKMWRFIKKYSHLELDRKTVDFCKLKLKEENYEHKDKLIKALSMLAEPNTHLEFIRSYIPTSAKVDLMNEEMKDLYTVQSGLIKFLHFTNAPSAIVPTVLQFCKGDYLKNALSPLYSSVYRLPDDQTKSIIDQLNESKAISVKKHAMNLSCVVYDETLIYDRLKNAIVPSLINTFKFFVKNPSELFWQLLETKIFKVESTDLQIFKWTVDVTIPFNYKARYIEAVWNVLSKHKNSQIKKIMIQKIDTRVIEKLNPDFVYKIIQDSIFKIEEANDFISNLLININDDKKSDVLFEIFSTFKVNNWNNSQIRRTARRQFYNFLKALLKIYMGLEEPKKNFVAEFSAAFGLVFLPHEAFEESVIIWLLDLKNETKENCSTLIMKLFNNCGQRYGLIGKLTFTNTLRNCVLPLLYKNDHERVQLCHDLMKQKQCSDDDLLIIKLLPTKEPEFKEHFKFYSETLAELEEVDNESIKLLVNLYLKADPNQETNHSDWE